MPRYKEPIEVTGEITKRHSFQELKYMENEPKYKVGDVLIRPDGEKRTIKEVRQFWGYCMEGRCSSPIWMEDDISHWKLQEPLIKDFLICEKILRQIDTSSK